MKKEENYVPYGDEWKKELMKTTKSFMVDFIRKLLIKQQELEGKILNSAVNKRTERYRICMKHSHTFCFNEDTGKFFCEDSLFDCKSYRPKE